MIDLKATLADERSNHWSEQWRALASQLPKLLEPLEKKFGLNSYSVVLGDATTLPLEEKHSSYEDPAGRFSFLWRGQHFEFAFDPSQPPPPGIAGLIIEIIDRLMEGENEKLMREYLGESGSDN